MRAACSGYASADVAQRASRAGGRILTPRGLILTATALRLGSRSAAQFRRALSLRPIMATGAGSARTGRPPLHRHGGRPRPRRGFAIRRSRSAHWLIHENGLTEALVLEESPRLACRGRELAGLRRT